MINGQTKRNAGLCAVLMLLLGGCGQSSLSDLNSELTAIRLKPRGRIEPVPEPVMVSSFVYAAHQMRGPFTPYVVEQAVQGVSGVKVEPDLNRPKEDLEQYPLESLHMRGTLDWAKTGLVRQAIVEDPSGQEHFVRVGNYLGKNQGKIAAVSAGQISIVEIVPDGRDGWVERPRSLVLSER